MSRHRRIRKAHRATAYRPSLLATVRDTAAAALAVTALVLLTLSAIPPTVTADQSSRPWVACVEGDNDGRCVWDARHLGNGLGHSYKVTERGYYVRMPHRRAHRLLGLS